MAFSYHSVTAEEITRLNHIQLVELLRRLVAREVGTLGCRDIRRHISSNLFAKDGGMDGYVEWEGGVEGTELLPRRYVFFQSKAGQMTKKKCCDEMLEGKGGKRLKPLIRRALDERQGAYVLFSGRLKLQSDQVELFESAMLEVAKKELPEVGKGQVRLFDASHIAELANRNYSVVLWVKRELGNVGERWLTWEGITPNEGSSKVVPFEETAFTAKLMGDIQKIESGGPKIMRLLGLPGLGKSRIVKQAFTPSDQDDLFTRSLAQKVLFMDLCGDEEKSVEVQDASIFDSNEAYLLVLDNCPLRIHDRLARIIGQTKHSLLTIGHDPNESDEGDGCVRYVLRATDCQEVVKSIVEFDAVAIPDAYKEIVADLAGGYPYFARLLMHMVRNLDSNNIDIGKFERTVFKRLIKPTDSTIDEHEAERLLRGIALFARIGIKNEVESEFNFVLKEVLLNGGKGIETEVGKRIVKDFVNKGIVEESGRYISVKPKPLAIRLAGEWWKGAEPDDLGPLISRIKEAKLLSAFCTQVEFMDGNHQARKATELLCKGKGRPLSSAEELSSELGSQLFGALSLVNPDACAATVFNAFGAGDPQTFQRQSSFARRNLLHGLARLAFRTKTFAVAAKTLLAFAVNETEPYVGNNSTWTFLTLFRVYLPGTECDLEARKEIIEYALLSKDPRFRLLGMQALESSFTTQFQYIGGAEYRGANPPLEHYRPKTTEEIEAYWTWGAGRWLSILSEHLDLIPKAIEILESMMPAANRSGAARFLLPVWNEIAEMRGEDWDGGRKQIEWIFEMYDDLTDEAQAALEALYEKIQPKSLASQIQAVIKSGMERRRKRKPEDDFPERELAENLSRQLASGDEWLEHLDLLLSHGQRWGYYLGSILGREWKGNWSDAFDSIFQQMESLTARQVALDVVMGILGNTTDRASSWAFIERLLAHAQLRLFSMALLPHIQPSRAELTVVLSWQQSGLVQPQELLALQYQHWCRNLSEFDQVWFFREMATLGESALWIAMDLIQARLFQEKESVPKLAALGLRLFQTKGITLLARRYSESGGSWDDWAERLIAGQSPKGITFLAKEIALYYSASASSQMFDPMIERVSELLLRDHFHVSWPILGKAFTGQVSSLDRILLFSGDDYLPHNGPVFNSQASEVLEWCKSQPVTRIARLARKMPLSSSGDPTTWHPFASSFIGVFGSHEAVLSAISNNLHSVIYEAPFERFFRQRLLLVGRLLHHSIPEVRRWAMKEYHYYEVEVEKARMEDEERGG